MYKIYTCDMCHVYIYNFILVCMYIRFIHVCMYIRCICMHISSSAFLSDCESLTGEGYAKQPSLPLYHLTPNEPAGGERCSWDVDPIH